jgi:predicted nucleotidyltransferase
VRAYDPLRVIVFGSFARGDTHEGSDLDLIVVKDTDERFFNRIGRVRDAAHGLGLDVQPLVYTPTEMEEMLTGGNSFLGTALLEGAVAYERDATGERLARPPSRRQKGSTAPSLR